MRVRSALIGVACALLACGGGRSGQEALDASVPPGADAGARDGASDGRFGLGQVDRVGHPLAAVLLVPGALQDEFNAQSSFETDVPRVLQDALESRLEAFDTIALGDGGPDPVDWPIPDGGTHPLLPMFVNDLLLVDTAFACTSADGGYVSSYLEIDREAYLQGPTHQTCGGCTPNEAVVDETLTLLVTANRDGGPTVSQGVAGSTKPATTTFPYLADPN